MKYKIIVLKKYMELQFAKRQMAEVTGVGVIEVGCQEESSVNVAG